MAKSNEPTMKEIVDAYKKQSPEKAEQKKDELAKKLKGDK